MAFLPNTPRQKKLFLFLILFLVCIGIDIYFGTKYAAERDTNFRAFRWDTGTLWRLKESYEGTAWGQRIHTNQQGFRGSINYPVRSEHSCRIITFGDSRTYGFSVKDHETYSNVLEQELRNYGIDAEVINAGVHGFSAVQCRIRLQQLLAYKPALAVFAPGYNDRRYLVIRPIDGHPSLPWVARIRTVVDLLQTSNTFFAFMYEAGQRKLKEIKAHPPGLDEVEVRVPEPMFQDELETIYNLCRENSIQPVFLRIYEDPGSFALVERADQLYRNGDYDETIEIIEEAYNTIPDRAYTMSRWVLGKAYRSRHDEAKATQAFMNHQPIGSIFGESVLRSEKVYMGIMRDVAEKHAIPLADAKKALVAEIQGTREAEDHFRTFFVDECHYSAEGHRKMGEALAQLCQKWLLKESK